MTSCKFYEYKKNMKARSNDARTQSTIKYSTLCCTVTCKCNYLVLFVAQPHFRCPLTAGRTERARIHKHTHTHKSAASHRKINARQNTASLFFLLALCLFRLNKQYSSKLKLSLFSPIMSITTNTHDRTKQTQLKFSLFSPIMSITTNTT